jgi:sterol 3beta-glucosyltransferase
VALVTLGSRGDVQPYVCLARGLIDSGHEVNLIGPRNGETMAQLAGVPYRSLPMDVHELKTAEPAQRMLASGRATTFVRWLTDELKEFTTETCRTILAGTESSDLLVSHLLLADHCASVARARGIPHIPMHLTPFLPSREYSSVGVTHRGRWRRLGPLNRASHNLFMEMVWRMSRPEILKFQRELGIPLAKRSSLRTLSFGDAPCLLAYSQTLFPKPNDWPQSATPVGFLTPSPELRTRLGERGLPPELEGWLEAGEAPVFLGFGSTPVLDGQRQLRTIRATLTRLGVRGILAAGWSGLDATSDEQLFVVDAVDHQALLPRCAATVHHGGAGTTHASLAAGTPTLVCSVFGDQPFWGARCEELGAGATIPFAQLTERSLTEGLRTVLDSRVAARAGQVAQRMSAESGVKTAVARLESRSVAI